MANSSTGSGSPCGACKFLRRKCAGDCIFAPYFACGQGAAQFTAIHKIFGASNVSKLLQHLSIHDRCEAVVTIAYEAQARIRDPVYGCVAHIFALQQQEAILQAQLMQVRAHLANGMSDSRSFDDQWQGDITTNPLLQYYSKLQSMSPQSTLDCIDHSNSDGLVLEGMSLEEEFSPQGRTKPKAPQNELGELQLKSSGFKDAEGFILY